MTTIVKVHYQVDLPSKWRWPWKENRRQKTLMEEWETVSSLGKDNGVTHWHQSSSSMDTKFTVHLPSPSCADAFIRAVKDLKTPEGKQKWDAYIDPGRRSGSSGSDVASTIASSM